MAGKPQALFAFGSKWDHRLMNLKRDKDAALPVTASPAERRPDHGNIRGTALDAGAANRGTAPA
jgi:hypothetical protein